MDRESLEYRTANINTTPAQVPDTDSDNFSTLHDVYEKFGKEMKDLEHINSFDVLRHDSEDKAVRILLRQIQAKQDAYKILQPLFEQLESAVQSIEQLRKGE